MAQLLQQAALREQFAARFGRPAAAVARAPGRVNLIGEHTDYNGGWVLPMALEQSTWTLAAPRGDGQLRAIAADLADEAVWPLEGWAEARRPDWTSYIAGVAQLLAQRGARLRGADILIHSDVPVGSGLSSSAALEVSAALALAALGDLTLSGRAIADLCRTAEHEYAGVPCGIMDQYVSALAVAQHAFLLDCADRTWRHIPLVLESHQILIVNSGVRHRLAAGAYAVRQRQCHEALAYFQRLEPHVRWLRDVAPAQVAEHAVGLGAVVAARARHVTTENARTLAVAAALEHGDLPELGRQMNASHASLRDDYEVSSRELDLLVELVCGVPGVLGARLTGGGFGGCIVALVPQVALHEIQRVLGRGYDDAGFGPARLMRSRPGQGATLESLNA